MKIKKLYLSDEVVLAVAEDIAYSFTLPKYEQFLTKHGLLSYNPDEYSTFNKIDFIRATLEEIDEMLFLELDKKNVLSDETKNALTDYEIKFENYSEIQHEEIKEQVFRPAVTESTQENKKSTSSPKLEVSNPKESHPSALPTYLLAFILVLIASGILWSLFPDYAVFILIVAASITVFLAIVIASLKHEGKISDNTFLNATGKIIEALKTFTKK